MKDFKVDWKYLDINNTKFDISTDYSIQEMEEMFSQKQDLKKREIAYFSYISHSPWGINFDIDRRVKRTNMQLRLPLYNGEGISWSFRKLNPLRIWASQDTLDYRKYSMVKSAIEYSLETKKPLLPVIIWHIAHEPLYKYVCHDGHHRIFVHAELKIPLPAIILEYWIDNWEDPLLPKKIHYREIDKLIKDLPIEKAEFSH